MASPRWRSASALSARGRPRSAFLSTTRSPMPERRSPRSRFTSASSTRMYSYDFRATGYPFRLYSGKDALERLPSEVERNRARRAFIVCGRTVSRKTPLVSRMRELLGARLAGVFDEIDKDTSRSSVTRATQAARSAQADLVIG